MKIELEDMTFSELMDYIATADLFLATTPQLLETERAEIETRRDMAIEIAASKGGSYGT